MPTKERSKNWKARLRTAVNILLVLGILTCTYFIYLSLTPEGYTGRILWFTYDVHNPRNPAILMSVLILAMAVFNRRSIIGARNRLRIVAMAAAAVLIMVGVYFFLSYKRHNRFPWERPNVVLIIVDTLRADHVSAYGFGRAETPNIDSLAEDGWLFERAYSHIPITVPSHSSIFTGRYPHDVQVFNNTDVFAYKNATLAEVLKEEGYRTAAVISLGVLRKKAKLNRGFDHYDDRFPGDGRWYNTADVITDRGIKWLRDSADKEGPFFLWLHYEDPHEPYCPPDSPPDISVEHDGKDFSGSLDSAQRLAVPLRLAPGENRVRITKLGDDNSRIFFTRLFFTGIEDGPLPDAWESELSIVRGNDKIFRQLLQDIQQRYFLSDFNGLSFGGLEFREGEGWNPPESGFGRERRYADVHSEFTIINSTGQPKDITLHIKGGIHKDVGRVWADYRREAEFADKEIGRFLDELKRRDLMDNTIIILMADHGEELDEHGKVGHIHCLYNQSLHVPLIVRDPDSDHRKVRSRGIARLIDVTPTILDMLGLHKPEYMQGRTLLEYILRSRYEKRPMLAETFRSEAEEDRLAMIEDDWLLIYSPDVEPIRQREFFNLRKDEMQWLNLALGSAPGRLGEMQKQLLSYRSEIESSRGASSSLVDPEREVMLQDLGYIQRTRVPSLLSDRGEPRSELFFNIKDAMAAYEGSAIEILNVESRRTGEGSHHILAEVDLGAGAGERRIIDFRDHVTATVLQQARQFPLILRLLSNGDLRMEVALAGDSSPIIQLYAMRLYRMLLLQPLPADLTSAFEVNYRAAAGRLEDYLGVAR